MRKRRKKYRLLLAALLLDALLLFFSPQTGLASLRFTGGKLLSFPLMLAPVFICIGLLDVWVERETMIRLMGESAGPRGALVALFLGVVTAVPLYALLPVAGVLLKKGGRIGNVLLFLCASASLRIPLVLFELSALGWRFTAARFGLNLVAVFAIALLTEGLLTDADKKAIYENANTL